MSLVGLSLVNHFSMECRLSKYKASRAYELTYMLKSQITNRSVLLRNMTHHLSS